MYIKYNCTVRKPMKKMNKLKKKLFVNKILFSDKYQEYFFNNF